MKHGPNTDKGKTQVPVGFEAAHAEWVRLEARISVKSKYRHGVQPEFYETPYWKCVREAILLRDSYRCSRCGEIATQVHHLSYHHRGEDHFYPECLVSICHPCHALITEDGEECKKLLSKMVDSIPNLAHLLVNERTFASAEELDLTSIRGEPLGQCPKCGARVFDTGLYYACEKRAGNQKLCTFRAGKIIFGRRIESAQITKLLADGKTDLLNEFVSFETSRKFKAFLTFKNGEVKLEIPPRKSGRMGFGTKRYSAKIATTVFHRGMIMDSQSSETRPGTTGFLKTTRTFSLSFYETLITRDSSFSF